MRLPLLLFSLAPLALALLATSARAGSYLVFQDDRGGFDTTLVGRGSTVVDSDGAFAPDPGLGTFASVTRSGTVDGASFRYTAYDLQFAASPDGTLTPGVVTGDTGALSSLRVEAPAAQSGGTGSGSWGIDSSAVSTSRRSGLLVDFTDAPAAGIGHFGVDLIDFEAGPGGAGELRLYAEGLLVFSTDFTLAPDGGNDATHFLGVVVDPSAGGVSFDQAVVLVGGTSDRWAADRVTFGVARTPEPGTWALFALGLGGLTLHLRRRRRQAEPRGHPHHRHLLQARGWCLQTLPRHPKRRHLVRRQESVGQEVEDVLRFAA